MVIFSLQVESALSVSPYVDNIMVHADPFHSYCVALVVASQQAVEAWASKQGIDTNDFSELCRKEEVVKEVQASLVKVLIFCHGFGSCFLIPSQDAFHEHLGFFIYYLPETTNFLILILPCLIGRFSIICSTN